MFKKRERPQATRARDDAPEEDTQVAAGDLVAKRSRRGTVTATSSTNEGGTIAASSRKEMSENARFAERQQDAVFSGFKASGSTENTPSSDATRRLEVDTDVSQDTRAILERNDEINKGLKEGSLEKGVYRGMGGYQRYANRSEHAIANSKYTGLLGPLRSSLSNVRSTLRIEYIGTSGEGGICKDYKETGYCGFGDSCKFAHDRSDYKPSYILEQEWEAKQKEIEAKKRKRWEKKMERRKKAEEEGRALDEEDDSTVSSEDTEEEELPTECFECGNLEEVQEHRSADHLRALLLRGLRHGSLRKVTEVEVALGPLRVRLRCPKLRAAFFSRRDGRRHRRRPGSRGAREQPRRRLRECARSALRGQRMGMFRLRHWLRRQRQLCPILARFCCCRPLAGRLRQCQAPIPSRLQDRNCQGLSRRQRASEGAKAHRALDWANCGVPANVV
ncbi:unnamed protein product [Effrenium voratum]|uniref:C3H1-type domain-containing protein n=1 Tax=Effrenium voratum TaxID=2562239 RepID=A0AA36N4W0_9DINO|nr:unnamed protein product [Effrenium voratum]